MIEVDDWSAPEPQSGERPRPDSVRHDAGSLIGGCYRVVAPLGTGSMGVVLLARDEALDRPVAIKFVHSHLLSAPFRDRFIAEARTMARVNHPNVVQVHAFGEHDGAPYFVMEYVDGFTLEQWIARNRGALDIDVVLRILGELCRGVSAIHASGAVHHDIKPSNVLLDAALRPRVADLGLAVFHREGSPTQREIVGTPTYMAPEIAFSKDLNPQLRPRADVYSLACVAYELFSGRPPFDGTGNIGMLMQHAMRAVRPPSSLRPDLPPELDQALLAGLAKDPQHRTPSAEAFRHDLVAACQKEREPVRILVAEDDDDFRDALQSFLALEFPNAVLECVKDGERALEAADRMTPSLAIIDLRMPGMGGIELTGRLRARNNTVDMPIIVLTGSGGSQEWERLLALGADRLLLKPVVLDDLVDLMHRVLGERRTSSPPLSRPIGSDAA